MSAPSYGSTSTRRLAVAIATAVVALAAVAPLHAQVVAPPVIEHSERAVSSFEIGNQGLTPLAVVIEPFSFWVDTLGEVHYAPFDSAHVDLQLSAMSVRLPPKSTSSVTYEAKSAKLPAWFVITASFAGPRRQGLNVRLQLPHVVYLNQRDALRREDIVVRAIVYDSAAKKVRFKIENVSDRLGRCYDGTVRSSGSDQTGVPSFPMFPHFWRWVEMPWSGAQPPQRLELKFERFTLQAARQQLVANG